MVGTGFNGEVISGISLTLFGFMLVIYGMVNEVAAILIPADIMIIAIGVAVIVVGVFTNRKNTVRDIPDITSPLKPVPTML